ncbi:hypothetical protein OBK00_04300 [Empedobacter falsenii]
MKTRFLFASLCLVNFVNAQVGIGTESPQVTLEAVGKSTDASVADGVLPPSISKLDLAKKVLILILTINQELLFM